MKVIVHFNVNDYTTTYSQWTAKINIATHPHFNFNEHTITHSQWTSKINLGVTLLWEILGRLQTHDSCVIAGT